MFVQGIISISSWIFAWTWMDVKNGNADFECEIDRTRDFSGIIPVFQSMTSKADCLDKIDGIYDTNSGADGFYSRCDDVNLMVFFGNTEEYAKKFSSQFSRNYLTMLCDSFTK